MRTRAGAAVAVPILLLGILLGGAARAHDYDELGALEKEAVDQVLRARRLEVEDHPEGKTIGAILVENLEVFSERDGCTLMWFNRFHATTRAGVIAREVLLRPGQVWDQERVDETRRGLRDPFLSNAVVLLPVKGARPETVDLLVVTRDVWSLRLSNNFEIQDGQLTLLLFSLTETNLFGWRKKLAFGFIMDQGSIEIGHLDGDVVQPLAAPLQEAAHRGLGPEGHEYLKVRTAKRDHCLLHALLGDDLAGQWLHTEELHQ